jgi:hypothetical protein
MTIRIVAMDSKQAARRSFAFFLLLEGKNLEIQRIGAFLAGHLRPGGNTTSKVVSPDMEV